MIVKFLVVTIAATVNDNLLEEYHDAAEAKMNALNLIQVPPRYSKFLRLTISFYYC